MGTAGGREDTKATGGTGATGIGTGAVNGCVGGEAAAMIGLGCGARTDLETSSNHRSASDGVRLWEGMAGEDVGGTTITGVGDDQSLPVAGATGDCGEEAGLGIGAEVKGSSGGPLNAVVI